MTQPPKSIVHRMLKVYIAVIVILTLFAYLNRPQANPQKSLHQINRQTHDLLHSLIKTKYFRTFRANLNRECDLWARNKICKSKSCTVCRCDDKDIPTNWIKQKTDQVQQQVDSGVQVWEQERQQQKVNITGITWIWHVQDQENDQGEYFDLDTNIESFTNYNGSTIWQMVYEENCFSGSRGNPYENVCKEQAVFYKVISGLHTSISSHLSRFYKNTTTNQQLWADLKGSDEFFVNHSLYKQRVLDYPERVQNLLFIYQIYLRAIKEISPYMQRNYTLHSDSPAEDLLAAQLLSNLSAKFQDYEFTPFDEELKTFFYKQNPKVHLYQKYIHNISRLMNCVQCEKCRLFGKMQTYGIGTALKILLGYNNFFKRNEMVALYNAWNKISMSVDFYYQTVGYPAQPEPQSDFFWLRLFATVAGAFIFFIYLIEKINIQEKVHKLFKNVTFPKERQAQKPVSTQQKKSA